MSWWDRHSIPAAEPENENVSDRLTIHCGRKMSQLWAQQLHVTWLACLVLEESKRKTVSYPTSYLFVVYLFTQNNELYTCSLWFCCIIISLCLSPFAAWFTGFGGCVDLIVDGVALLKKINLSPTDQPLHHDYIENAEQLAQSFAYFFAPGAAAEWVMFAWRAASLKVVIKCRKWVLALQCCHENASAQVQTSTPANIWMFKFSLCLDRLAVFS